MPTAAAGAWNAIKCVKETGKKIAGDVCMTEGGGASGKDDCAKGNMCWNVNDKNEGICVALCTGTEMAPKCDPGFKCAIANEGVLNLCLPTCDPLLQDCDGADLCIANQDHFLCVLDASGDGGKQNDPCEFANSCDKGLACPDPGRVERVHAGFAGLLLAVLRRLEDGGLPEPGPEVRRVVRPDDADPAGIRGCRGVQHPGLSDAPRGRNVPRRASVPTSPISSSPSVRRGRPGRT
ncbi:MAG: hypothetical protein IPO88_32310 [Nannocystis sp.]|uniref:hypothetical protein n=1 Tax=Nannocystis sp. TaxID=1962667 RepID=UPI002428B015|nr:hypothetical protein [Nannocystis sp.]MBK9758119.1 hypothetical protein [Nannocystis sp.]